MPDSIIATMNQCKVIGCDNPVGADEMWCGSCDNESQFDAKGGSAPSTKTPQEATSSGGDNNYWIAEITDPKRLEPCKVECEDLIEYFQFNFAEGEAFKALWRKGKANLGDGKPGDTPLRNAEKVHHMGGRMVVIEQRKLGER